MSGLIEDQLLHMRLGWRSQHRERPYECTEPVPDGHQCSERAIATYPPACPLHGIPMKESA